MLGYYPNSNAKPRGSNLDIYKTNKYVNFIQIKVCTSTYIDTSIYVHRSTYINTYIYMHIYTYKTSIHNMTKQNIHGNIHANAYI